MAGSYVQRIRGKELASRTAERIARVWADTFNNGRLPDEKKFRDGIRDDLLFIARDAKGRMRGLGCLKPVEVTFLKQRYSLMGLKGIVSLVRGKGIGRLVVEAMRDYLLKQRITGVGFCSRYNTPFYEKCGFHVQRGIIRRFVRKETDGRYSYHHDINDEDVISLEGTDKLMTHIFARPRAKVYVPFFW